MSDFQTALDAFHHQNYTEAFSLLRSEAEAGNSEAQCLMGNMYQLGLGVEKNISAAINWYLRASERGHAIAANNLGGIYLAGDDSIPRSPQQAEKWYSRARELGFEHTPAISDLPSPAAF